MTPLLACGFFTYYQDRSKTCPEIAIDSLKTAVI